MLVIRNVSESKSHLLFDQNKDGYWFKKIDGKFVRSPKDEQNTTTNEFFATNVLICYSGKDFRLNSWTDKKVGDVLIQTKLDFPPNTIEEIRQDLWKLVKLIKDENFTTDRRGVKQFKFRVELPISIIPNLVGIFNRLMFLSQSLKEGKTVTIWYVSSHELPKVKLVERFLNWYSQQ